MSSVQLDGSHTPANNGGAAVGYQGRKSARTTNMLFLADNSGMMLACAEPQAGNHNDVYELRGTVCTIIGDAKAGSYST